MVKVREKIFQEQESKNASCACQFTRGTGFRSIDRGERGI